MTLTGCKKTIPVKNYLNQPITQYDKQEQSTRNLQKAIIKAATSKGWKIKNLDNNKLEATLNIRKHLLTVDITDTDKDDTDKEFSIKYKDSQNLLYDGKKYIDNMQIR